MTSSTTIAITSSSTTTCSITTSLPPIYRTPSSRMPALMPLTIWLSSIVAITLTYPHIHPRMHPHIHPRMHIHIHLHLGLVSPSSASRRVVMRRWASGEALCTTCGSRWGFSGWRRWCSPRLTMYCRHSCTWMSHMRISLTMLPLLWRWVPNCHSPWPAAIYPYRISRPCYPPMSRIRYSA